jgi:hypothetical protein
MTSEPETDLISSISTGIAKGTLEWSKDEITKMVKQLSNGELAFIEDQETIDVVKKQREKPDLKLYRKYILDRDLILQIQMGFVLKRFEATGDQTKLHDLRDKILKRYGKTGLHVAQLVQSGIFSRYVGLLIGDTENDSELKYGMESLLKDIDKHVIFVDSKTDVEKIANVISNRINVLLPRGMILFSKRGVQKEKAAKIIELVRGCVEGYRFENQVDSESDSRYDFIIKIISYTLEDYLNES